MLAPLSILQFLAEIRVRQNAHLVLELRCGSARRAPGVLRAIQRLSGTAEHARAEGGTLVWNGRAALAMLPVLGFPPSVCSAASALLALRGTPGVVTPTSVLAARVGAVARLREALARYRSNPVPEKAS